MKPPTRLDSVVRIKERQEDKALKALADARAVLQKAQQAAEAARQVANRDERSKARAEDWQLLEAAHIRALSEARIAAEAAGRAAERSERAQADFLDARRKAEVVRRVAENRREEARQEGERAERRDNDEVAGLLYTKET